MKNEVICLTVIVFTRLFYSQGCVEPFQDNQFFSDENRWIVETFLRNYKEYVDEFTYRINVADFTYSTNMTDMNDKKLKKLKEKLRSFRIESANCAFKYLFGMPPKKFEDDLHNVAAEFEADDSLYNSGIKKITDKFRKIYNEAQVLVANARPLARSEQGVIRFFKSSFDYDDLAKVWKKWRDVSGKRMRKDFATLVKRSNAYARGEDYEDFGEFELYVEYSNGDFGKTVMQMIDEIRPLYEELHAYVRYKLTLKYPGKFKANGPIPAHILGNPWAQNWKHISSIVQPYPKFRDVNITRVMQKHNWKVSDMVKKAEAFFVSLGLPHMTKQFWRWSVFEDTGDAIMECHPHAWNLRKKDDFRMQMCAEVNFEDFYKIHHEMGHIQYFMLVQNQNLSAAQISSGFHEAIGDVISLSVVTAKHFKNVGLLDDYNVTEETEMNSLMKMALLKIPMLPFAATVDGWRWRVFNGSITEKNYNSEWWRLRRQLQGLMPPVPRSEEDFDPGAKYHIIQNTAYIDYFVSYVLQFQFFEALCNACDKTDKQQNATDTEEPLHRCDFYRSKEAGKLLKKIMIEGSKPTWLNSWPSITCRKKLSVAPVRKYFARLENWMREQREKLKYPIGWD